MKVSYQIAVVQSSFENGNVSGNLKQMRQWIRLSKSNHPDVKLILFPELAATGYYLSMKILNLAEERNGPIYHYLADTAVENDVYIGYGYVEKGDHEQVYNSFMLIDPYGNSIANYRKIHITSLERNLFQPGSDFVTADTEMGTVGLLICWDLAFPESARKLAVSGAELILAPSAWEHPYEEPFKRFGMARALDNTVFVAVCNHTGRSGSLKFFGRSCVYGPDGFPMVKMTSDDEGILVATIAREKRQQLIDEFYSMMKERRTDLY